MPSLFAGKAWFWVPVPLLVALDLWSKAAVFEFLSSGKYVHVHYPEYSVWTGPISFSLVKWWNTGTVWGLLQDFTGALIVLRCVALVVLVWFAWRTAKSARFQQLVLALIMAGAVGNLYDNFTQENGAVRDFLFFFRGQGLDRVGFPAFNVADSCITVGAIGLILLLWRSDRKPDPDSAAGQ